MVVFGTPAYEPSVSIDYHNSMMATTMDLTRRGIQSIGCVLAGNCFLDRARNEIVDYFLHKTDATDLFFIDADVGWDYSVIPRILEYSAPIVGGLVPKRGNDGEYHQNTLTGVVNEDKLIQSMELPTAFMRLKRSVFEKMDAFYPDLKEATKATAEIPFPWPHTPYFQDGLTKYGVIGEDIFFNRQWHAMGEFAWIDVDVSFVHRGTKIWKGNFFDHAKSTGLLTIS